MCYIELYCNNYVQFVDKLSVHKKICSFLAAVTFVTLLSKYRQNGIWNVQITLSFCEFMKINTEILHSYLGKSEKYLKFSKNLSKVLFVFAIYIDFHIRYYFESFISVSLNFVNLQNIVKVYCWLNGNTNRYTSCIIIRLYVESPF